ncbi:MAG: cysteine--tRNA ligase [Pacificimonas sp.]
MTEIRLYDTAAREKRLFIPHDPKRVQMYVCGPTVHARAHIGNFRAAVTFDTLYRLLRHEYGAERVQYARNITDIDDKIMARAMESDRTTAKVAAEAEGWYLEDSARLNILEPDFAPHATDHLLEMIAMIETLVDRGHAYIADGHALFDVSTDSDYGALCRARSEDMIAGARVEVAPYKRNPQDFVMWKPSSADQPGWDSPWGRGRPGWHLECSAMIAKHLGTTIDIHGGGQDLIFPHHENEAAQSRCTHGEPLARYWLHNGFLSVDAEKMSKSIGNVVTVDSLTADGHRGEAIRLALMSAHYRQPLDWTDRLLDQAKATLDRWYRLLGREAPTPHEPDDIAVAALADDVNTPAFLSRLSEIATEGDAARLQATANLVGLLTETADDWARGTHVEPDPGIAAMEIERAIAERAEAKAKRDFVRADAIRDELLSEGIFLEDGADGTTWRRR